MNKQQLAARIWASANEMRSKIEASEYKDYILGFIFYKFLSEKEEEFLVKEGFDNESMSYVNEDNQEVVKYIQDNIGYFIAYENLYSTWLSMGSDFDVSNVTDALSAFSRLVNPAYNNVFDKIFETLETGLSKLGDTSGSRTKAISGLLQLIKDIPMDGRQGYDVLGYIYEYLISNFAANAGKKAGEFYTPHEVSLLMSEIIAHHLKGRSQIEIYDPTSGSGSLLINIGQAVAKSSGAKDQIKYYAQELKENTYNLTRMNLVMRGVKPANIIARNGDTLEDDWPYFQDGHPETYEPLFVDAVVSNPPYSQKWDPEDKEVDPRFNGFGIAPKSKADYAFLLHDLYHLQPDGIMCIVLPHGVLFRGGEEGEIRRNLIERNHIDAIIGLPANIFFGTGIPTIIMVLKKRREGNDVLIIDASKGFVKEGKNNKLRSSDIRRIVDAYIDRKDIARFCRAVSKDEIRANDYNLNIPRYVDSSEKNEGWDIYSTMFGGIPVGEVDALKPYWDAFPSLREGLFEPVNAATVRLRGNDIASIVNANRDVYTYREVFRERFDDFGQHLYDELVDEVALVHRASEEDAITNEVFSRLDGIPLIDRYMAFQELDDVWQAISVDLEILQTEGFDAAKVVDPNMVVKKQKGQDVEVQDGWVGHVFPFALVQDVFLGDKKHALEKLQTRLSAIDPEIAEIFEGLTDEEKDALGDAVSEESFVSKKLSSKIKELKKDDPLAARDEESLLSRITKVSKAYDEAKSLKKEIKSAQTDLDSEAKKIIESLSDDDVKTLLDWKWIEPIVVKFNRLTDQVIDSLISQVKALSEKYTTTYSDIDRQIHEAESELAKMLGELTGNEFDLAGINELMSMLGGER